MHGEIKDYNKEILVNKNIKERKKENSRINKGLIGKTETTESKLKEGWS